MTGRNGTDLVGRLGPNFALLSTLLGGPSFAQAEGAKDILIEQRIFSTLVAEGAYLHRRHSSPPEVDGAGSFYLDSVHCGHDISAKTFGCTFVDTARPHERREVNAQSAQVIYENLAASGIKPVPVPFSRGTEFYVSAEKLQCSKSGMKEEFVQYSCRRLKPLVE